VPEAEVEQRVRRALCRTQPPQTRARARRTARPSRGIVLQVGTLTGLLWALWRQWVRTRGDSRVLRTAYRYIPVSVKRRGRLAGRLARGGACSAALLNHFIAALGSRAASPSPCTRTQTGTDATAGYVP
jgi:hypothetical protein